MASLSDEHSSVSPKRIRLDDTINPCSNNPAPHHNKYLLQEETIEPTPEDNTGPFILTTDLNAFKEPQNGQLFRQHDIFHRPESERMENEIDEMEEENEEEDEEEEDDDDVSSTVSNVSDLSGLSEMSGQQWKPIANVIGTMSWIEKQMMKGVNPRVVFSRITGDNVPLPETISDLALWKLIVGYLLSEPPKRSRLPNITNINDAVHLLKTCSKIIILTGAGVSVSCGIPDFRSKDGVYARLAVDFPDLPDPQAMFDINYFRQDPRPFFKFAREIYPGQFKPSPCHRFIKMLERQKKLLRNYTQNIDTLEKVAGIENVVECHGSFSTASCTLCGHKVTSDDIREEVFRQQIPLCSRCIPEPTNGNEKGVMKPDIVFFGEGLPEAFHDAMAKDKDECDLLIVIGSSLKVRPVALIPSSLPSNVPQILINRERLPHLNFDIELLGDSDIVIDQLCHMLGEGWEEIRWREEPLSDASHLYSNTDSRSDSNYSSSDEDSENEECIEQSTAKCQRISRRVGESEENSRHMSLDSSRDSGIGESSNSSSMNERSQSPSDTELITAQPQQSSSNELQRATSDTQKFNNCPCPKNSYYRLRKRRYIFPGAEVFEHHLVESSD